MANLRLTFTTGGNSPFVIVDTAYTASIGDKCIVDTAAVTITLPAAEKHGQEVWVKNLSSGAVVVDANASELINFSNETMSLAAGTTYKLVVSMTGYWNAVQYQGSDDFVKVKAGEVFMEVNMKAGQSPISTQTKALIADTLTATAGANSFDGLKANIIVSAAGPVSVTSVTDLTENMMYHLQFSGSNAVTFSDGNNLKLSAASVVLDNASDQLMLWSDGTNLYQVAFADND